MAVESTKSFLIVSFLVWYTETSSYFGMNNVVPISSNLVDFSGQFNLVNQSNILKKKKRRMCRMTDGVGDALSDALYYSVNACKTLFKYERWNCAADPSKENLLKHSYKETSFVYAIRSAGLVHSFARACSTGRISRCTCDVSFDALENRRTWTWGGCGDNFEYGVRFTRKCVLVNPSHRKSLDIIDMVHRHNSEVGIRTIKEGLTKVCKCHGVSGSCTSKTCWKQLAPFTYTSRSLKRKYDQAVKAESNNDRSIHNVRNRRRKGGRNRKNRRGKQGNEISQKSRRNPNSFKTKWRRRRRSRAILPRHSSKALLYLADSPDFCNTSSYSNGTSGRECVRGENCRTMCCGRGHNVQIRTDTSSCKCRVVWCCHVHCQLCVTKKEVYTCK